MVDSNIPDIALEPDKTVKKVNSISFIKFQLVQNLEIEIKIMDRFKLDISEEQSMENLVKEIESNYDSIVGNITDLIHGYVVAQK